MKSFNINKNKLILIVNCFWAIPLVFLFRFINQFNKINIIKIRSDRFGHFAPDGAEQVAKFQIKTKKIIFYVFDWYICNHQWAKMLSKKLPVYNVLRPVYFWNEYIPGGKEISKPAADKVSRDINLLFTRYNVRLPFEQKDQNKAINWLKDKGWTEGEPFYCVLIRDNAYLNTSLNFKNIDWEYHNYRNSNIESFYQAINWLTEQGVWVVRMGKVMKSPLTIKNNKVIDFPFEKNTSDLLDVWLFANCNGCISTGTGPDLLTGIYGNSILFLNYLPLFQIRSDLSSITYPKKLIWEKYDKPFTIDEYIFDRRLHTNSYKSDEIKIIDMTEYEILNATKEFYYFNLQKKSNKIIRTHEQKLFWNKILLANKKFNSSSHNKIHPESNISKTWLNNLKTNDQN